MTKRTVEETLRQELVAAQKAVTAASAANQRAAAEVKKADSVQGDAEVRLDAARDRAARTKAALEALLPLGLLVEDVEPADDEKADEPDAKPVPV